MWLLIILLPSAILAKQSLISNIIQIKNPAISGPYPNHFFCYRECKASSECHAYTFSKGQCLTGSCGQMQILETPLKDETAVKWYREEDIKDEVPDQVLAMQALEAVEEKCRTTVPTPLITSTTTMYNTTTTSSSTSTTTTVPTTTTSATTTTSPSTSTSTTTLTSTTVDPTTTPSSTTATLTSADPTTSTPSSTEAEQTTEPTTQETTVTTPSTTTTTVSPTTPIAMGPGLYWNTSTSWTCNYSPCGLTDRLGGVQQSYNAALLACGNTEDCMRKVCYDQTNNELYTNGSPFSCRIGNKGMFAYVAPNNNCCKGATRAIFSCQLNGKTSYHTAASKPNDCGNSVEMFFVWE